MRVLDLGSGGNKVCEQIWPEAEVVHVDIRPEAEPDVVADIRALPEDLGLFEVIFAGHVLEHLSRLDALPAVQHWGEFLTTDGELHIVVPDLEWAGNQLSTGYPTPTVQLLMHIFGDQGNEYAYHRNGFTALLLRRLLEHAGYQVRECATGPSHILYPPGSEPYPVRQIYALAERR